MRIENWANALNQAGATAAAMVEQGKPYEPPRGFGPISTTNLQVAGSFAQAEEIVRGDPDSGRFSVIGLRDGEIVGGATVNASKEMALLRRMVSMSARPDRASLENPAIDLRRAIVSLGSEDRHEPSVIQTSRQFSSISAKTYLQGGAPEFRRP